MNDQNIQSINNNQNNIAPNNNQQQNNEISNKKIISRVSMKILNFIKNILFPRNIKCIICQDDLFESEKYCICKKCFQQLPFIQHSCKKCGTPLSSLADYCLRCKEDYYSFDKAISPLLYEGEVKNIIHHLKYNNHRYLVKPLANLMCDYYKNFNIQSDLIAFVPMHQKKLKKREYNQAELLASEVSNNLNIPISKENIVKTTFIKSQTKLNAKQRLENIKDSFSVINKKEFKNKNILLIDDVFTTGATTNEISKLLKKSGCKKITVLTLAHTDLHTI